MVRRIPAADSLADLGYRHAMGGAYRASWSNLEVEHFIYLEGVEAATSVYDAT
jgi:hypothetical protein